MNRTINSDEKNYIEICENFANGYLRDNFKRYDDANTFAESIHLEANRRGILNGAIPKELGGRGISHYAMALSGMAMAKVCAPTTFSMGFNHGTMRPIIKYGRDWQKERFITQFIRDQKYISWCMTEPEISGSNLFRIKTTATKTPGGWLIEGTKCMIGNGTRSDLFLVLARTIEDDEFTGLSIFLVNKQDGVAVGDNPRKLGFHSLPTPTINFRTEIPANYILGELGHGVEVLLDSLDYMRFGGGIVLLGLCYGALDDIRNFATNREVYGGLLSEKSHIQINVGTFIAEALAVKNLLFQLGDSLDQGKSSPDEAAALKLLGSSLAQKICAEAVQICGWRGIDDEYPIQKRYRDARQATIYEGTNEVLAINLSNKFFSEV